MAIFTKQSIKYFYYYVFPYLTKNFFSTVALAAAIPKIDLLISLVGAVSSSTLALMAPPIIDTVTNWPDCGKFKWKLIRNIFLFTVGFLGFVTGTFVSVQNIIKAF